MRRDEAWQQMALSLPESGQVTEYQDQLTKLKGIQDKIEQIAQSEENLPAHSLLINEANEDLFNFAIISADWSYISDFDWLTHRLLTTNGWTLLPEFLTPGLLASGKFKKVYPSTLLWTGARNADISPLRLNISIPWTL